MEKLRDMNVHANVQSCLDKWLEGIRKVQARRKEEIVNAANRHRAGIPRQQEDKGECCDKCVVDETQFGPVVGCFAGR